MHSPLYAQQRVRMQEMHREAAELASVANKIAGAAQQVIERGGTLDIQPQMAFLTSVYARMQKDWGVIEHLQQANRISLRPMPQVGYRR
jgi:hypothetical protein